MAGTNRYEIGMYQRMVAVGSTPFERISTMYLGSLRIAKQGLKAVKSGETDYAMEKAEKLQAIVQRLEQGLDYSIAPDLCENLSKLYGHMLARLNDPEIGTSPAIFEEVHSLLNTLWMGFQEAHSRTDP
jgi:flagellar biosynthetic protein FliS